MTNYAGDPRTIASVLAAVMLVDIERPATRPLISLLVDGVSGVSLPDAERDEALKLLLEWGLVQAAAEHLSPTAAGLAVLAKSEIVATCLLEQMNSLTESIRLDWLMGSNNSFKPKPLRGSA